MFLNSVSSISSCTENRAPGCSLVLRLCFCAVTLPAPSVTVSCAPTSVVGVSRTRSRSSSLLLPPNSSPLSPPPLVVALLSNTLPVRGAAQELDRGICSEGYHDLLHLLWCPGIPPRPPPVGDLSLPLLLLRHHEVRFRGPNLVGIFDEATSDWISSPF